MLSVHILHRKLSVIVGLIAEIEFEIYNCDIVHVCTDRVRSV